MARPPPALWFRPPPRFGRPAEFVDFLRPELAVDSQGLSVGGRSADRTGLAQADRMSRQPGRLTAEPWSGIGPLGPLWWNGRRGRLKIVCP